MNDRLKPLVSLPFIICLMLLMINDLYLKEAFHNTLTGKLSDFCGLFIFPIFWSVLFPRHKWWVFILSGLLFIYWKSEYAAPLIDFVGRYLFSVQRTVDYTDLIALPVLGVAALSLKQDTANNSAHRFFRYVSPYAVAVLTLFSFCATSQQRYIQTFEQPQYVLFRSDILPDSAQLNEDFHFYHFDSLLVVQVNQLYLTDRPAKYDDYNKNVAIKGLDKNIAGIIPGINGLMPAGKVNALTITTPQGDDYATFKGGRLDGHFVRKKGGKVIIDGFYKLGLEDSIWTFKSIGDSKITKITFVNGERTKVQHFDGGDLTSSRNVNTRADVKKNKVIQIAVLALLMIAAAALIVVNYRQRSSEAPKAVLPWKWLACLLLPFGVWLMQLAITCLLGDDQFDLLFLPVSIFLIYVITCPLFFIIVFGIKLSRQVDLLWYCLIFALAVSIWIEYDILAALSV